MNINNVTIVGRATRDPELRHTANSNAVCNFTLAVDDGWGDNKSTAFIDVTCWTKTAEAVAQHAVKGQVLGVCGSIRQDSWQDQQGNKRSKLYVNAQSVQFGQKPQGAEDRQPAAQREPVTSAVETAAAYAGGPHDAIDEDDIPFHHDCPSDF